MIAVTQAPLTNAQRQAAYRARLKTAQAQQIERCIATLKFISKRCPTMQLARETAHAMLKELSP